jgi:hypothetical protein
MRANRLFTRMIISLSILMVAFIQPGNVFSQPLGTTVSVSPASSITTLCTTAEIAIHVADVSNLTAYHLDISFDPGFLDILEVRNGVFLNDGLVEVTNGFDNEAGAISWGNAQQNNTARNMTAKNGSGDLIIIKVQAVKAGGTVNFTIDPTSSILVDWPDLQPIPFSVVNGSVTTQKCAPIFYYMPEIHNRG